MKQNFGRLSINFVALALPLGFLAGSTANYWLKQSNSKNLDITNGSAYLQSSVTTGAIVLAVVLIVGLILAIIGLKKDVETELAKNSLVLINAVIFLCITAFILQTRTKKTENIYKDKKLETFFQQLSK